MLQYLIGFVIAAAIFCIIIIIADSNRFVVAEHTITSAKIRKPYTFVLLSDLHNKSYGKDNERLMEAIDRIQPDSVIVAGDMYTAEKGSGTDEALKLMERLAAKYPVYYGNGNHEQKTDMLKEVYGSLYEDYAKKLQKAGVHHLVNEHMILPGYNIDLCGSMIGKEYFSRFNKYPMHESYLNNLLGEAKTEQYQILIAHNPDYFPNYAAWGADLVLSGHIHGGIINVPFLGGAVSPAVRLFPKYDGGLFQEGSSVMLLSRGLGTHTIPVRMFNPGELPVVHLKP